MADSIFAKMKPPVVENKPVEETKILSNSKYNIAISLLEDTRTTISSLDDNEDTRRVHLHVNKSIRILKNLQHQEEMKNGNGGF